MILLFALAFLNALQPAPSHSTSPPRTATGNPEPSPVFDATAKEAGAARDANKVDEAIKLYQKAVKLRPTWGEGWWYIGTLNYDSDRYAEGRDAFRRLVAVDPKLAQAWALLGLCEYQTREYELALAHLRHAKDIGLEQNPELQAVAFYHTAILLTRFEHFEDAQELLAEVARRGKDDRSVTTVMGLAALRKPIFPAEIKPGESEAVDLAGTAQIMMAHQKSQDARKVYEELVAKYPKTPGVHALYGYFLLGADPDQAIVELRRELEVDPLSLPAMLALGLEYVRREEPDPGLPLAEQAVKIAPDSFAAHNVLGRLLVVKGEVNEGIRELEISRRIAPDSPQTRFALATAYAKAGRSDDAAKERAAFLRLRKATEQPVEKRP